ncbi:hypothetical protein AURDEDRAFT_168305 [Auricularia subglabra TFB-10046 SS5]|nr:hypothetical protein AURDEDRAFT_168305 [Auricularia subglabra TFB-10046 SS5]
MGSGLPALPDNYSAVLLLTAGMDTVAESEAALPVPLADEHGLPASQLTLEPVSPTAHSIDDQESAINMTCQTPGMPSADGAVLPPAETAPGRQGSTSSDTVLPALPAGYHPALPLPESIDATAESEATPAVIFTHEHGQPAARLPPGHVSPASHSRVDVTASFDVTSQNAATLSADDTSLPRARTALGRQGSAPSECGLPALPTGDHAALSLPEGTDAAAESEAALAETLTRDHGEPGAHTAPEHVSPVARGTVDIAPAVGSISQILETLSAGRETAPSRAETVLETRRRRSVDVELGLGGDGPSHEDEVHG